MTFLEKNKNKKIFSNKFMITNSDIDGGVNVSPEELEVGEERDAGNAPVVSKNQSSSW